MINIIGPIGTKGHNTANNNPKINTTVQAASPNKRTAVLIINPTILAKILSNKTRNLISSDEFGLL